MLRNASRIVPTLPPAPTRTPHRLLLRPRASHRQGCVSNLRENTVTLADILSAVSAKRTVSDVFFPILISGNAIAFLVTFLTKSPINYVKLYGYYRNYYEFYLHFQ